MGCDMSGESYMRKRSVYEVGFGKKKQTEKESLRFNDDHELLAYLIEQEHMAEKAQSVSYDSLTSD